MVGGFRTAFGRFGGALREVNVLDLGRQTLTGTLDGLAWPIQSVDEFLVGMGMIEGGLMVPARQIAMASGLPRDLPTLTVDRACCSGTTVLGWGARAVAAGASSVLALGIENMSRTPRLLHGSRWNSRLGEPQVEDLLLLRSPLTGTAIAQYVGEVALEHGVGRDEQDHWALRSHQRHATATSRGFFTDEIIPIDTPSGSFSSDEHPRPDTTIEALGSLPTVRNSPTVTAGNAPGLNDGAAAIVVASGTAAHDAAREPLARIASYLQTAESPISSAYLPGLAIKALLDHHKLRPHDLDVIEINEAYAATPLVSLQRLAGGDQALEEDLQERTNVNGGAVAVGHPIGASGTRIALTAARRLHDEGGRWAAVAICGGFGQTDALLLERSDV